MVNHSDIHLDRADRDDRNDIDFLTLYTEQNCVVRQESARES